jgi:hypothetical protein
MAMVEANKKDEDYVIKPQSSAPSVDTSSWPLLLKNYDKRECNRAVGSRWLLSHARWFNALLTDAQCL